MYDGNGNGNRSSTSSYTGSSYTGPSAPPAYTSIGGVRIKPVFIWGAIAAVIILAIYLVVRFLNAGLVMHFGLVAGALLLIANLRELIGQSYSQRGSTALLNCLIGGALIFAWLSQIIGALLWIPAILLIGIAVPLALGRASVYSAYVNTARSTIGSVRRMVGR